MGFKEMVQWTVNAKAKVGLRSSSIVRDLDIRCPRGHRSSNSTASNVQTQRTTAKDSYPEEPKIKKAKSILFRAEASEPLEQACKEKKRKKHLEKRDKKEQTLASTINATEVQQ